MRAVRMQLPCSKRKRKTKAADESEKQKRRSSCSAALLYRLRCRLAQQLQHACLRLVGERECGDCDRLASRKRLAVGCFLIRIGKDEVRSAGLQHVDQVLVEVLADLHDR